MKHERIRTLLISTVLALLIGLGTVRCLSGVFSLQWQQPARFFLLSVCAALLGSTLYGHRKGHYLIVCILSAGAGYLLHRGVLLRQTVGLLYRMANTYNDVYRWFVPLQEEPFWADLPLGVWGILLELAVCRSVSRRKSVFWPVFLCLLSLLVCMGLPDAAPDLWALLPLLASLGVLVLSGTVRRDSAAQGNRLALAVLLPLLASMGILFLSVPRQTYVDRSDRIREYLITQMQQLPDLLPENTDGPLFSPQEAPRIHVDLAALTGQDTREIPILGVTAEKSGPLYLRGQDYDLYTGTGWASSGLREEDFSGWGEPKSRITIRTYGLHDLIYLPYFPGGSTRLSEGMLRNDRHLLQYTLSQCPGGSAVGSKTLAQCLALPEATAARAKAHLPQADNANPVDGIRSVVQSSAAYDQSTGKMPDTETDFAMWFLEQSDRGYCVHFATAAVVLLRAAGIPARYVTGFKADTVAGEEIILSSLDAHAWAEYYDADAGSWMVLEATPAAVEPETIPAETVPVPTEPAASQAPTIPDAPPERPRETRPDVQPLKLLAITTVTATILLLLLFLQRTARLTLRFWQHRRKTVNQQALSLWQEAAILSKLLREPMPEDLTGLAEKARFSQHILTPEELAPLRDYNLRCRKLLEQLPWYSRLICRYYYVI